MTKKFLASNYKNIMTLTKMFLGNNFKNSITKSKVEIEPLSIKQLKNFEQQLIIFQIMPKKFNC
jgi:hypothetical protein